MKRIPVPINTTLKDAVIVLCDGHPGGLNVMIHLGYTFSSVNPDLDPNPMQIYTTLDELEIYGPRIWLLFKDVCQQEMVLTHTVLRAYNEKMLTKPEILAAIDGITSFNEEFLVKLFTQLQEKFPTFGLVCEPSADVHFV